MQETFRTEFRILCLLAFPMIIGGAANDIIPFINTAYMGRLGEDALAAVALVNTVLVFVMVLFWGIFATVSTLVARYEGEGRSHLTTMLFRSACLMAIVMSLPVMIFFHFAGHLFILLGQNVHITQLSEQYFQTLSFAITPDFLLVVLYDLCFGLSRPKFVMYVCLLQIPVNLVKLLIRFWRRRYSCIRNCRAWNWDGHNLLALTSHSRSLVNFFK